jgi:hypothetical protein
MKTNKKSLRLILAALVVFGAMASTNALALDATESVSFTVTHAVTVGGHELEAGRYTVRPASGKNALIITRANDNKFVTFVLPVSTDAAGGENAAVNLVEVGAGPAAVSSVYFPEYGRAYYFNTAVK